MGDLCGCPAELKDDDEREVVDEGCPLRRAVRATQAGAEDEGEGQEDAGGSWEGSGAVRDCEACFPGTPTAPASSDRWTDTAGPLLGQGWRGRWAPSPSQVRHMEPQTPSHRTLHRVMSFLLALNGETDRQTLIRRLSPPVKFPSQSTAPALSSLKRQRPDPHAVRTRSHRGLLSLSPAGR